MLPFSAFLLYTKIKASEETTKKCAFLLGPVWHDQFGASESPRHPEGHTKHKL